MVKNFRSNEVNDRQSGQHLLVISGAKNHPERARTVSPGVRISLVTRHELLQRVWNPENYERLISVPSDTSEEEWLAIARFIHSVDPIDSIVNFTEKDMEVTAAIAADLGLRSHSRSTARQVFDKAEMRARLQSSGVDDTPCRRVRSLDELQDVCSELGYPLIAKPVSGVASQGISLLRGPQDIEGAFSWSVNGAHGLDSAELIVETYHEGKHYSVECVSEGGEHLVVGITEKHVDFTNFIEIGHGVPADVTEVEAKEIESTVKRMLDALSIQDTVTHTEVVTTATAVRIVETHLRPGGGRIANMLKATKRVCLPEIAIRQYLGQTVFDDVKNSLIAYESSESKLYAAVRYATPAGRGKIRAVKGIEAAREVSGVREVAILKSAGDELNDLSGGDDRAALVWAVGSSPGEAMKRAQLGVDSIVFVLEGEEQK
ncbi:ATP-grasp domain-containing protein [Streptomyces qinglanensis]|uniref:ATP-grasp domain-containing protein n=1 Tax=Streptomyces qinglanensis TaxID=943816 RepID=UPI0037B820D6